jgi:hypothetical protein
MLNMPKLKRKAYQIRVERADIDNNSWGVYSACTPGKAKSVCLSGLKEAYTDATFAWITTCRRAPEYDTLAEKYPGCIAWKQGREHWEQDKGHWDE